MKYNVDARLGISRVLLHSFAILTALSTLVLICSGGLVTSKGVGMAVPDWPTTYGYNMFLFPISRWVGGIFYEHTHRLIASGVGFLTVILAVWILVIDPRRWVKLLGVIAVVAVISQGILGGLRVTLYKDEIGIFHGMLAQAFLSLICVIAMVTSPSWCSGRLREVSIRPNLCWFAALLTGLIFFQLGLGATMRHEHAGLAIPDFPLAYGKIWPDTSSMAIDRINQIRVALNEVPTTATQITIQMLHRSLAMTIWIFSLGLLVWTGACDRLSKSGSRLWAGLLTVQVCLGAWTIWSNKAADVATAHVAIGSLCLVLGVLLSVRAFCRAGKSPDKAERIS